MSIRRLTPMFLPKAIALIGVGAADDPIGATIARNLLRGGFKGPVMPVHPTLSALDSVLAYPTIDALPRPPDLAVLANPLVICPEILHALGAQGCSLALLLGKSAPQHHPAIIEAARAHNIRLIGPNGLGLAIPAIGLNATFAPLAAKNGDVALVTKSSAMAITMMDWAEAHGLGFSHVIGMGDMIDLDLADILDWLAGDHRVRAILIQTDGIGNARQFMSAARACARAKPVIIAKTGRCGQAGSLSRPLSGASPILIDQDRIFDAAFRRAGMLRVDSLDEMFSALETLGHGRSPLGRRMAILTNGHGLGQMATDTLGDKGGVLADFSAPTTAALTTLLPPGSVTTNPLDLPDSLTKDQYAGLIKPILADPLVDACLILHAPLVTTHPGMTPDVLIDSLKGLDARQRGKILVAWMGEGAARAARSQFAASGLPSYERLEPAIHGFMHMVEFRHNQQLLMRVPPSVPEGFEPDLDAARALVARAVSEGKTRLDEVCAKALLQAYHIPITRIEKAATPDDVAIAAARLGGRVAVKIISPDIALKSDVGGVRLNLVTPEEAAEAARIMVDKIKAIDPTIRIDGFVVEDMIRRADACEIFVGILTDPIFGPVIAFGHGGREVRVVNDLAVALAPLDLALAHDLIKSTRISNRLAGFGSVAPVDQDAIALTLVKLSQIAADFPEITALEINPILAFAGGVVALDAKIDLDATRPRTPFAILPYPTALERSISLKDGRSLLVRPVRPEDAPAVERNFYRTKPEDIQSRFFVAMHRLPDYLLARLTQIDYDREMAFVALPHPGDARDEAEADGFGIVRLAIDPDGEQGEFALTIRSDWHGRGLGSRLMRVILDYARSRNLHRVVGTVLRENGAMIHLMRRMGFTLGPDEDPSLVSVVYDLTARTEAHR